MKKNEMGMVPLSEREQVLLIENATPAELGICTKAMSSEDVLAYVRSYKGRDARLREELELIEKAAPAEILAAL